MRGNATLQQDNRRIKTQFVDLHNSIHIWTLVLKMASIHPLSLSIPYTLSVARAGGNPGLHWTLGESRGKTWWGGKKIQWATSGATWTWSIDHWALCWLWHKEEPKASGVSSVSYISVGRCCPNQVHFLPDASHLLLPPGCPASTRQPPPYFPWIIHLPCRIHLDVLPCTWLRGEVLGLHAPLVELELQLLLHRDPPLLSKDDIIFVKCLKGCHVCFHLHFCYKIGHWHNKKENFIRGYYLSQH